MIARSELEAEVAMLTRELASITASADRSRALAARLKDESDELKSRIESAKDEEERDRKRAEELEEELADQLDELERINGTGSGGGGTEKAVSKEALLRSASASGDAAASVGGRSRASSAGRESVDNACADEVSVRSRGTLDGATIIQVRRRSRHGSDARSGRNTATCSSRHPSTGRPASALQQQWETAHSSHAADMPKR
jgi:hypothetical protein